ncbi:MAG: DUF4065 domain-containing protein [Dehalococcoidia bacterium]|nr:DUF4065 domain-containing protein [Dehalococcoidia bacterium]
MKKYKARDIAEYYICCSNDKESGDLISNLKIQKLVYYAQGIHLAATGKALFDDEIVAWAHGPVVEGLYHAYKGYGEGPIEPTSGYAIPKFDKSTKQLLDEVYRVLGQYSAWKLRAMAHSESPWINANRKGIGTVITHKDMTEHFKPFVKVN